MAKKLLNRRLINILSIVAIVLAVAVATFRMTNTFSDKTSSLCTFIEALTLSNIRLQSNNSNILKNISTSYNNDYIDIEELKQAYESPIKNTYLSQSSVSTNNQNNTGDCPTADIAEGEESYNINERYISNDGTKVSNFFIKNTTGLDIDFNNELNLRPDVDIKSNNGAQVLILHTHTSEAYIDKDTGQYPASFYPRSANQSCNVVAVGKAIQTQLEKNAISTVHDTTVHDFPSYNGAYYRSEQTVKKNLEENPNIQVVLDIHRDALGNDEVGRTKPTFEYNSKKAAQIMIIAGCDTDGTWDFPDWEYNLRLALRIQQKAEEKYPGMTRPIKFFNSQYNMQLTHGSLLIEVGTDVNTVDEAVYTGELLGNVLSDVLGELKVN